jgi:hypothetical protein
MGVSVNGSGLAEALRSSGLEVLGVDHKFPAAKIWTMTSTLPRARFHRRVLARGTRSVARINAAWLALATRHGLFADGCQPDQEQGEFLLSLRGGGEHQGHWLRVRLVDPWDLAQCHLA